MTGKRQRSRAFLVRLVAVILVGAGLLFACQQAETLSKADYEILVMTVYDDVRAAFASTRVDDQKVLADRISNAQSALRKAADRLADIRPPRAAKKANRELVQAWRSYAADLDEFHAAILRGDTAFQHEFSNTLVTRPSILQAKEAADALKESGFDIGVLGKD